MKKTVIRKKATERHHICSYWGALSSCLAVVVALNACSMNDVRDPGLCGYGKTDDELGTPECQCAPVISGIRESPILDQCGQFIPNHSTAVGCSAKNICEYECDKGFEKSRKAAECVPEGSCISEFVCKGSDQYRCSNDELIESCEYGCDLNTGICLPKNCEADDVRCTDEKERAFCEDGKWQKESCKEDKKCVDGSCIHWVCDEGTRKCQSNTAMKCIENEWVEQQTCEFGCDADIGACLTSVCTDGDVKCDDEGRKKVCREGSWKTESCQDGEKCIDGACKASGCENDSLRCNQNVLQICADNEWVDQETCKDRCIENQCVNCDATGTCVYLQVSEHELDISAEHSTELVVSYIIDGVPQIGKELLLQMMDDNCIEKLPDTLSLDTKYMPIKVIGKPITEDCSSNITVQDVLGVARPVVISVIVHPLVDENHNYMIDELEDFEKAVECKKDNDCGSGFCDSFIGYRCSKRCKSDDECISNKYLCRSDGRCAPRAFETVWNVTRDNSTISFPVENAENCEFNIDWGDNTGQWFSSSCPKKLEHIYIKKGEYHVVVTGTLDGWGKQFSGTSCSGNGINYLERVESFGPVGLAGGAFANTPTLKKLSSVDIPDASKLKSTKGMFCSYDKTSISNMEFFLDKWDMSNVKDMSYMFYNNKHFDLEIGSWNTSKVNNMSNMFSKALGFNQSIGNWDTSEVEDMSNMFQFAEGFNQDIGNWDTSKVNDMSNMFQNASAFNQDIGNWDTSKVEDMSNMFQNASAFDQNISSWNVSNVEKMNYMFYNAKAFNQNLSAWKLSSLKSRSSMFSGSGLSKDNFCAMYTAEGDYWKNTAFSYGLPKDWKCE